MTSVEPIDHVSHVKQLLASQELAKQRKIDAESRCGKLLGLHDAGDARDLHEFFEYYLAHASIKTGKSRREEFSRGQVHFRALSRKVEHNIDPDKAENFARDYRFENGCDVVRYGGEPRRKMHLVDRSDSRRTVTLEWRKGLNGWFVVRETGWVEGKSAVRRTGNAYAGISACR